MITREYLEKRFGKKTVRENGVKYLRYCLAVYADEKASYIEEKKECEAIGL